jgi:hypothetical protein
LWFDTPWRAAPGFGGIAPYNKLIDRVSGDNIISTDGEFRQKFQLSAPDEAS